MGSREQSIMDQKRDTLATNVSSASFFDGPVDGFTTLEDADVLKVVTEWVHTYLPNPHHELGRPGPVCPFAPTYVRLNALQFKLVRGIRKPEHFPLLEAEMLKAREIFLASGPRGPTSQFQSFVLIFPDVAHEDAHDVIDVGQARMKHHFVTKGLMLGEFHPLNSSGSLNNSNFHSLRSPVSLFGDSQHGKN